jgi:hypothetical protein
LFDGQPVERLRLALEVGGSQILVGRDEADGLYVGIKQHPYGGAACGSKRWVLRESGAIVLVSGDGQRCFVSGIVADEVIAVRVGDVRASLRDNAFLAEIGRDDSPVPVITTPSGDREVGRPTA